MVVLAIQGAKPLNEPRLDDGYFQSWEDLVLLVLFGIFTYVSSPTYCSFTSASPSEDYKMELIWWEPQARDVCTNSRNRSHP